MKKLFLLFVFSGFTIIAFSQTLFTYGNSAVDKAEFIRAYNKNKTAVSDKEKALREYLDLYIKFKLKVKAANELKLDTLPQLVYDAQSFRSQIEQSYLNNDKVVDDLLTEAFNRSQKDLRVFHYFVAVDTSMKVADTLKAFKAIYEAYNILNNENPDLSKLSSTSSPIKQSDLGFITAFSLPYEYENIVYSLKPGHVSKPFRSKSGWHIFKLVEERKPVGKWKIGQILISFPPNPSQEEKKHFKDRADTVYSLLLKGEDFGKLARQFSDDKITYTNNGELPEFGTGKYDPSFEKEIFALTKDGEISKPFESQYGYHIVKRLSQTPVPKDMNDPSYLFDLKQRLQQDSRINYAKDLFTKEILKRLNFKKASIVSTKDIYRFADSAIANPKIPTSNIAKFPIAAKVLATFTNNKLTGKEWLDFVRMYKGNSEFYQGEDNSILLEKFFTTSVTDNYKKNLENYNPEFKYQMEEFRDGNVLFEIMERNIWGKASSDTIGLKNYYTQNKNKYLWEASANIILFSCGDKTTADNARATLLKSADWRSVAGTSSHIQADSGRYELSQLPIKIDLKNITPGSISTVVVNPTDGTAGFIKLINLYPAGMQRNFEEARGLVINDYQNILEDKWISELKKKYPVKINEDVFQSLLK